MTIETTVIEIEKRHGLEPGLYHQLKRSLSKHFSAKGVAGTYQVRPNERQLIIRGISLERLEPVVNHCFDEINSKIHYQLRPVVTE